MSSPVHTPANAQKKSTGVAFLATSLPRSRTYSHWSNGPDAGFPSFSGRPRLAGDPLFRISLSAWRKRKLPTTPGRSFGCGGAIKNSPVSGAWIADGTDGHIALVELAIAFRPSLYRDVRFFIYSFAVRILGLSPRYSLDRHLYQQVCQLPSSLSLSSLSFSALRATRFTTHLFLRLIRESFIYARENRLFATCSFDVLFIPYIRLINLLFVIYLNLCRLICADAEMNRVIYQKATCYWHLCPIPSAALWLLFLFITHLQKIWEVACFGNYFNQINLLHCRLLFIYL